MQMILLEEHLSGNGKTCKDCIMKHVLWLQALLNESLMLNGAARYRPYIVPALNLAKILEYRLAKKKAFDALKLATAIRLLRKPMMGLTFGRCVDIPGFASIGPAGTAIRRGVMAHRMLSNPHLSRIGLLRRSSPMSSFMLRPGMSAMSSSSSSSRSKSRRHRRRPRTTRSSSAAPKRRHKRRSRK